MSQARLQSGMYSSSAVGPILQSKLRRFFRFGTLQQALVGLLASVIVPLLLGALILLVAQSRQEREIASAQLETLAQTLVQAVDRELDHGRAQLEVLAAAPVINQRNWSELHSYAAEVAGGRPGAVIGLVGPDGQQIFNTALSVDAPQPNLWKLAQKREEVVWEGRSLPVSSQNLTREVFATRQVVYSDLYYGLFVQRPALALSIPVMRNGQVLYALTMSFPPSLLDKLFRTSVRDPGLQVAVTDRRGLVVASNAAAASRLGDQITPIHIPAGSISGIYDSTAHDGTRLRGAYAISAMNGFVLRVASPTDGTPLSSSRLASAGWLTLVIAALAASVVLATLVGRRISRPLGELAQAAREGTPPAESERSGIEEIDALAQALRAGAEAERQRRSELVVSAQRAEAEQALRRADRQKDEFLATLAHELRNPLAPIRNAVEMIRRSGNGDERVQRARDVIERQLAHLTRLVDDLLDVSRITLGTVQLRKETLDLRAIAANAADSVAAAVESAGLTAKLELDAEPVTVQGDGTRLAQCIVNLLNNSIKFTPKGGEIRLRVDLAGSRARVEVRDTGIGISPDSLERIFEPFVQEKISGSHGNTGLGIGLALTRKLVVLHGGTVRAESAGPGKGATFIMELPGSRAEVAQPAGHADSGAPGASAIRVLVVDDNQDAALTLSEMLSLSGFLCTVAHNGADAVSAVDQQLPHAVLLDIGLPDIDGYEVCRRIRQRSNPPILIALTGWGQEKDRRNAESVGFDAHLTKPADPQRLMTLLNTLVAAATEKKSADH